MPRPSPCRLCCAEALAPGVAAENARRWHESVGNWLFLGSEKMAQCLTQLLTLGRLC